MERLLASSSTRILVNGELSEKITHQRGLRQGDLLSPLLFMLVMDTLEAMLKTDEEAAVFTSLGPNIRRIRASFYTPMMWSFTLVCTPSDIHATKVIFFTTLVMCGLRTNYAKKLHLRYPPWQHWRLTVDSGGTVRSRSFHAPTWACLSDSRDWRGSIIGPFLINFKVKQLDGTS